MRTLESTPRRRAPRPPRLREPGRRADLAPVALSEPVRKHLRPSAFGAHGPFRGRVFEIVGWKSWPIARQVAYIRKFIESTSRDPQLVDFAVGILRRAGVDQRRHAEQWAALLRWVQRNIYYVNERDERLQSPQFTLARGFGDCDDMIILLCALGDALRLPWRLVISGFTQSGQRRRWVDGQGPVPSGVKWTHIYGMGGWPPFRPSEWRFMEPTLNVPFGWDVMREEGRSSLPELGGRSSVPVAGLGAVAPGGPPADVMRAGRRLYELLARHNRGALDWVAYDGERWLVHQGGCAQVPLAYPRAWEGRPVARVPGGIRAIPAPAWSWGPGGAVRPALGDATPATSPSSSPAIAPANRSGWHPYTFVVTLPWREIVVATIPTVLSAWAIGRFMGERRAAEERRACERVRRAA